METNWNTLKSGSVRYTTADPAVGAAPSTRSVSVREHDFDGTPAITLTVGTYEAMMLPEMGGNLVALKDTKRGLQFLHTPKDLQSMKKRSTVYGIPVLFPPNRYEDGTFTVNEKTYQFPINEEETHNYIHGFFKDIAWEVTAVGTDETTAYVEVSQRVDARHEVFHYFPHEFSVSIRYTLSNQELRQEVKVENHGSDAMPLMLGFHTTLNAPFHEESTTDDYTIMLTLGQRWEMSSRMLPTGSFLPLSMDEQKLKESGVNPFFTALDNHYTASPQGGRNYAALTDHRLGIRLVYEVGEEYTQWMVFNNHANGGFICPEPQTSVVNAPNTELPQSESGLIILQPAETWSTSSHIYVEDL